MHCVRYIYYDDAGAAAVGAGTAAGATPPSAFARFSPNAPYIDIHSSSRVVAEDVIW